MSRRHKTSEEKIILPQKTENNHIKYLFVGDFPDAKVHHFIHEISDKVIDTIFASYSYTKNEEAIDKTVSVDDSNNSKIHESARELVMKVLLNGIGKSGNGINKSMFGISSENDEYPSNEEDDKPKKEGRPVIQQLCSKFKDASIWSMVKTVFRNIYHESILKAKSVVQYLVCFFCSLFRIVETDEPYGRVTHFYRLMEAHLSTKILHSVRTLQDRVRWLTDKAFVRFKNTKKEEDVRKSWENLEEIIYGQLVALAPQYAI